MPRASASVRATMMPGTRRAEDLRRDPRLAVHGPTMEADDTDAWSEAKLDARAVEVRWDHLHTLVKQ